MGSQGTTPLNIGIQSIPNPTQQTINPVPPVTQNPSLNPIGNPPQINVQNVTPRSILDMPVRGSRKAPKTFKGQSSYVTEFLAEYEDLLSHYNVTNDGDKCKTLLRYCSRVVKEVVETLDSFISSDWDGLKTDLVTIYDKEKQDLKYKKRDLKVFTKNSRHSSISSLSKVRAFFCDFQRIAGWLKKKQKITNTQYNKALWDGLPRHLRSKVENQIMQKNPNHDLKDPFSATDIISALESIFRRDRFDADASSSDAESDSDTDKYSSTDDSSGASDSDDSISDTERQKNKRPEGHSRKGKIQKRRHAVPLRGIITGKEAQDRLSRLEKEERKAADEDRMEVLIKKLQNMLLDDLDYAVHFYRAYKLDPSITQIVRPPYQSQTSTKNASKYKPRVQINNNTTPGFSLSDMACYGCGDKGHTMINCPKLAELVSQGKIKRDDNGKFI
ncbi:hypothetical protein K474DRAFT_1590457, partial [Panus rudis PR-1116 ss-1]